MHILYADEFGHGGIWDPANPRFAHHPLFGIAGFAITSDRWADVDRGYFRLKQSFYSREIATAKTRKGLRPERFEPKELSSRRDIRFTGATLDLLAKYKAALFAFGQAKPVGFRKHDGDALYGRTMQGIMNAYERYLRHTQRNINKGIIVLDRRAEGQDVQLLRSAQTYLFSPPPNMKGGFARLVEVPFLVRSEWHHGVQLADTVARAIGHILRFRVNNEAKYKKFDTHLGAKLDALTIHIDHWTSVYVRPLPGAILTSSSNLAAAAAGGVPSGKSS